MNITAKSKDETGRAYAMRTLRDNIISTELKPGTLLSENDLAAELGLSRTPVREAIIELSRTKIIEVLPQRGSRVSLIDMQQVEESNFFRKTMECAIVKLVCEMATSEDLLHLEENVKLQEFYLENPSPNRLMELDDAFHHMLFQICNKIQCYEMVESMSVHFDRIRRLALSSVKDLKIVNDHRSLIEAIKNCNQNEAEAIISKHLSRFQVDEKDIRNAYPDYFVQ